MPLIMIEKPKKRKLLRQLISYILVGWAGFFADIASLQILIREFRMHYLFATLIGFFIGLLFNYFLALYCVFNAKPSFKDFTVVMLAGLIGLAITEAGMYVGYGVLHIPLLVSKCFVTMVVSVWNYLIRKLVIYRDA